MKYNKITMKQIEDIFKDKSKKEIVIYGSKEHLKAFEEAIDKEIKNIIENGRSNK